MTQTHSTELVTQYYRALDTHDYALLETVLAPTFVQHRPDRTFEDRDAFIRFMREERPNSNTRHDLESVIASQNEVAARGRLVDVGDNDASADDAGDDAVARTVLFHFADHFLLEDGQLVRLETYTR